MGGNWKLAMKSLIPFLLFALSARGVDVMFTWDARPASEQVRAYRFYDVIGTNRVLLGIVVTNFFVVTNWQPAASRTVTVTASNLFEGPPAVPLQVPSAPGTPTNLTPVPLSLNVPLPSVIEISQNLTNWQERVSLYLTNGARVAMVWKTYPREPMMFMRQKATLQSSPPLPR
jgi:hypothetical protein